MKLWTALFFICLLAFPKLQAQLSSVSGNLALKEFVLSGMDERGQPWHLSGTQTRSNGYNITIDDFKLDFMLKSTNGGSDILKPDKDGKITVQLRSDYCSMNSVTKEIKSSAPVKIAIGKNVHITGIGYDVDLPGKVILLRSTVHVTMRFHGNALGKQLKTKDTKK